MSNSNERPPLPPLIKTTLYLPPELHKRAKMAAAEQGTSMSELLERALHELLERLRSGA